MLRVGSVSASELEEVARTVRGVTARYTALVCEGWLVIRFTLTQLMHPPATVLEQLCAVRDVRN